MAPTAIIVPVPEADPMTDRWRRKYTDDGADGMPPHVTLLYPFVDESLLVAGQMREIREVLGAFQPFEFALREYAEFPPSGTAAPVLYLAPEPPDRFREITDSLVRAFPGYPPYGGQFGSVVPHLTIAGADEAPLAEIRDDIAPALPIRARVTEARVMRYGDDGWRTRSTIYFGRRERLPRRATVRLAEGSLR